MALSNSFSYTETADSVIQDATSFLGFRGEGETLSPDEYQLAMREANRLCKSIQVKNDGARGMKTFQRRQGFMLLSSTAGQYTLNANSSIWTDKLDATTGAGNNSTGVSVIHLANMVGSISGTTIGVNNYINIVLDNNTLFSSTVTAVNTAAKTVNIASSLTSTFNTASLVYFFANPAQPPQAINWANLRDINGFDTYVDILTYEEFCALPAKNSPQFVGIPSSVYYEPHLLGNGGQGHGLLNTDIDGCSDLTRYLVINYIREIDDLAKPSDELALPKEWYYAFVRQLAFVLHPHFEVVWTQSMELMRKEAVLLAQGAHPKKLAFKYSRIRNNSRTFPHR